MWRAPGDVDALKVCEADEDIDEILGRNMPSAGTWGRVAIFDAIRAASADHEYYEDEGKAIRRRAKRIGVADDVVAQLEALQREEAELKQRRINLVFGGQVPYQDRG